MTMPLSSRSHLSRIALAITLSPLLAAFPLPAQSAAQAEGLQAAPQSAIGPPSNVPIPLPPGADSFNLIKKTLVMSEMSLEVPVPLYRQQDVLGPVNNAPNSIACGGTVSEGATADADPCRLQYALQFQNGYLMTNGTVVAPNATAYNGAPGGVTIEGYVGDILQVTVKNELPEAVNGEAISTGFYAPADNRQIVHWHGMELDNESDGTPVTEFGIPTGEQRTYQFRLYRPGNYWFHPHVMPVLTEHRGMVGKLIVRSYEEDKLVQLGVLPQQKAYIQLYDTTVANEFNRFQWRAGVQFNMWTQEEVDNHLFPNIEADLDGDHTCDRGVTVGDCIIRYGELVFVNGKVPTSDDNIETINVPQGQAVRVAFVNSSSERIYRLRLLPEGEEPPVPRGAAVQAGTVATGQCYAQVSGIKYTGADPLACDQSLPMIRIGGQNGLLDRARIEGQPEMGRANPYIARQPYDALYRTGEDIIGVSERTEFVIQAKDRDGNYLQVGQSLYVWMVDYPHGAFLLRAGSQIGNGDVLNRDTFSRKLVRIKVVPNTQSLPNYNLAVGDLLMAHPAINRPSENLKTASVVPFRKVPKMLDPFLGTKFQGRDIDQVLTLGNFLEDGRQFPTINGNVGSYEGETANGDEIPTQLSTRYANVGDTLEIVVANATPNGHHPFHAHGFSFQPIALYKFNPTSLVASPPGVPAVIDSASLIEPPVYVFDYNEMIDVKTIQVNLALKYRVRIADRFKIPDKKDYNWVQLLQKFPYDYQKPFGGDGDLPQYSAGEKMGGALGRWLMHCHILHHGGLGMMTDFCIAPKGSTDASSCKIDVDENIYKPIVHAH